MAPIRPRAQIPQAEAEADRLSANVTASSPEGVKADLGRRMGADFSGIRFHTGADAAARANSMGARAFTSGADVYFGEGGFDASVAAHELVHTAQQGVVSGETSVSVPVGTVQREPQPLTLGRIKRAYKKDKDYMSLRDQMDAYNKEQDPIVKAKLEKSIMMNAANYVDKFSTRAKPIHKGRTKDAESLIYQLSANKDMQEKAQANLTSLDTSVNQADVSGSTNKMKDSELKHARGVMHGVMGETKSGIATGQMMGTKLSPALRAILTETMATQSTDAQMGISASGGQYTGASMSGDRGPTIEIGARAPGVNLANMENDGFGEKFIQERKTADVKTLLPSFFHEATHGHADQAYGSVVTMSRDDIQNPHMVKREESERMARAKELADLGENDQSELVRSVVGRANYGQNGGIQPDAQESYYDRAKQGYLHDNQDATALDTLKASREQAGLANAQFPGMIEYDPAINEALMNFELSGGDKDSLIYRKLKAAALVSHAKRHNANLERNLPPRRS